jgi:hypothetical protein
VWVSFMQRGERRTWNFLYTVVSLSLMYSNASHVSRVSHENFTMLTAVDEGTQPLKKSRRRVPTAKRQGA